VQSEGSKKLYTITGDGRSDLKQNRDLTDTVLDRLAAIGKRAARWQRRGGRDADDRGGPEVPALVKAALDNLREAAAKQLADDADAEPRVVEILARAAADLRRV
jgi:DNA-binding PadR family transcriptional regulator